MNIFPPALLIKYKATQYSFLYLHTTVIFISSDVRPVLGKGFVEGNCAPSNI